MSKTWNHNIHFHDMMLAMVPANCNRALDIGCGDGIFTRKLAHLANNTIGVDIDKKSIDAAKQLGGNVHYVCSDFNNVELENGSFDFISSIASLHHMDFELSINRICQLLRPGGIFVVIGLAKSNHLVDFMFDATGFVSSRIIRTWKNIHGQKAPMMVPEMTYSEVRKRSAELLKGYQYRRHVLFRYSLIWTHPEKWAG